MPKKNSYQLTIATLIYFIVLKFNLVKDIKQSIKLLLVCKKAKKELNLEDYKLYTSDRKDVNVKNQKIKGPLI